MTRHLILASLSLGLFAGACTFGANDYELVDATEGSGGTSSGGADSGGADSGSGGSGLGGEGGKPDNGSGGSIVQLPAENCTNGIDDDGDGNIDSADSECEECTPSVPNGWIGPAHLYVGASDKEPVCGDTVFAGGSDPFADDVTCSACGCSQSGTGTCSMTASGYNSAMGGPCGTQQWTGTLSSSCVSTSGAYFLFGTFTASGRTCSATGGAETAHPQAAFTTSVLGCGAPVKQGSCGADSFVRPEAPAGYGSKLCIAKEEDVAECPDEYPERSSFAQDIDDQRSCSKCSCGNDFSCSATITGYSAQNCAGTASSNYGVAQGACMYDPNVTETHMKLTGIKSTGSCLPSTSGMVGDIVEQGTVTVCCR